MVDLSLYGLVIDCDGTSKWLEENKRIIEDYNLSGEVLAEFKMKEWNVTVRPHCCSLFAIAADACVQVRSPDGVQEQIRLDPYMMASDAVSILTQRFTLPATEEYSFFLYCSFFLIVGSFHVCMCVCADLLLQVWTVH